MSVLWIVVLLNSLLIPSQGFIIPLSVARPDMNGFKGSPAKDVPQRASSGLLDGNLLGGLLGKKGLVGGLLGENGPVGGLLGERGLVGGLLGENGPVGSLLGQKGLVGGLLGENGPVGSLLGERGLVGGLLGENGPVGGLLGERGLVGGLLGENGPVGGLFGQKGLVGGLLGENGPVGSLLGEKGLVGGLLGENGAVGGLLGGNGLLGGDGLLSGLLGQDGVVSGLLDQDGILGGLLGKGGVVDGLLGKDGLVDTLLDTVLDLLIGKNGLLGRNGLVGSLLGKNGEELIGLRIVNNTLPKISLRSLPGFGHQVDFKTQLLVESSVPGQPLCQQVEVDATILVRDTWTPHQNALNCETVDINTHVRPRVPVLEEPLKRLLSNTLKDLGCNIINAKLKVLSSLLGSRNQVLPLGALGDLPSFSILSGDAIQVDLNLLSENGRDGVTSPMQELPLSASLQLATGRRPRLSLSQDTLSALLEQGQGQGALNLSITSLAGSNSPLQGQVTQSSSLTVSALFPFIPQLSRALPGSLPLELRVRVRDEPVVAVRDGRATVTLRATIDVSSPALQTPQGLLFSVDVDIVLNITPSVSDGKLQTSLALDSINLTRFPQSLDAASASSLAEWLKKVLTAVYVPSVQDALRVSVPLPNVLNTNLRNAEVAITDEDEFSGQSTLGRSCSGGTSLLLPF
ncbi:BPI fold-containing family B member 3-like isoform X1 [Ammospiza nelsoni]|uniref:BPI fold-containing family B member 3-like isoform X1 n=1 Tax=Ammospiza nelsoni TaxID=2857394 RepID=UPI002869B596|nr:BPI fold-containing family B member 3-like isoform X1 [Ammospiza nelsoni]